MKIAVVHDWLDTWRGGENVLAEILQVFPDADLFALVDFLNAADRERLQDRQAITSFLQHAPFARRHFRMLLPLFPLAIESLDVRGYDAVVSSSHAVAKGVRTRPGQLHLCYCYTPMRYAWDLQEQYLDQTGLGAGLRGVITRRILARVRAWDRRTSARVTQFVAISGYVAERIRRSYGRTSIVIHPPVAVPAIERDEPHDGAYVTVSALVPYKRVDVLVEAFRALPERTLVVVGDGPERRRLEAGAPSNVHFAGRLPDAERDALLRRARAFVFAAEEDFGIAPLEAQARGTPVIAFSRGGLGETIRGLDAPVPTGVLYDTQTAAALAAAVRRFEENAQRIDPLACRHNAARFSPERFRRELREAFERSMAQLGVAHEPPATPAARLVR